MRWRGRRYGADEANGARPGATCRGDVPGPAPGSVQSSSADARRPSAPVIPARTDAENASFTGLIAAMVAVGGINLLLQLVTAGPVGFAVSFVLSVLPAPLLLWLVLRRDRFEPEPPRLLAICFFWGATIAILVALVLNVTGGSIVGAGFGAAAGELYTLAVSAPIVEETAKAAVLFIIVRRARHEFNGIIDGVVYASMVGLGFAIVEDASYYAEALLTTGDVGPVVVVRGLFSPFAHPLFTSMTGIGIALALRTPRIRWRWVAGGLLLAMALHCLWNTSFAIDGLVGVAVYFFFFVPLFFTMLLVIRRALRNEGEMIRTQLGPEVADGEMTTADVEAVATLSGRRVAVKAAASAQGSAGAAAVRRFHHAATELAFYRHAVVQGTRPADDRVESEHLEAMRQARPGRDIGPSTSPSAGVVTAAAGPVANAPQPGWYPDPGRRHDTRYWDGVAWTAHVADAGVVGHDPPA